MSLVLENQNLQVLILYNYQVVKKIIKGKYKNRNGGMVIKVLTLIRRYSTYIFAC